MHRPALAGAKRRTRRTYAWTLRPGALENWLARNGTSRSRTHSACGRTSLCCRCGRPRWRSFVDRARPGLRNNHARRRRLRRARSHGWCSWPRRYGDSRRRRRSSHRGRRGSGWRNCRSWRRRARRLRRGNGWRRCRYRSSRLFRRHGHDRGARCRSGGWRCGRRLRGDGWNWLCGRRRHYGLVHDRRRGRRTYRWRRSRFLLLRDGLQHITGTGDVRQINLSLDFVFAAGRASRTGRRGLSVGRAADVGSHLLRFMLLQRTGMGLLFGHSDERERVENGLALNFQFPGEIVDSNLTHPAFLFSVLC
jgi:hypothetical protein